MTRQPDGSVDRSGYRPDFELSHRGVIREDNWPQYEARGFRPVAEDYDSAQLYYGIPNVYTGDAYDYEAGRPLRHMSGEGVYVTPEGRDFARRWLAKQRAQDWSSQSGGQSPSDPATN